MSGPRRLIVWVCCGCDDCEPLDGSKPSQFPCSNPPSSNGAEVVMAEDYDRLREALQEIVALDEGASADTVDRDLLQAGTIARSVLND